MQLSGTEINILVQGFIGAIILGMFYSLWATTRAYGGLIGSSVRLIGFGILFITIAVIEKMLLNFDVLANSANLSLIQDIFNLVGLSLLAWGFSKLASAAKA